MFKKVKSTVYSFCLLFLLSSFMSSIAFSYIADFRGGWHTDFPLGDAPDTVSFSILDVGAYRELFTGFKLGISYNFFNVYASPSDFRWHALSPELLFFFKDINEKISLYVRGGGSVLNLTSTDKTWGTYHNLKVKVRQHVIKAGVGCEVKIIDNLSAYGEVLMNYARLKLNYDYGSESENYMALLFGAGAVYTLD